MKEIIYAQAGLSANHIGSHFWNLQESYIPLDEEADEEIDDGVEYWVSYREGQTRKGETTLCPRAILFDLKENFGMLSKMSGAYADDDGDGDETEGAYDTQNRLVRTEYRQPPIPPPSQSSASSPRYWSDYAQATFHPRSFQPVPGFFAGGRGEGAMSDEEASVQEGHERFRKYDSETGFMEESFRFFLEECDQPQGIQLIYDMRTFGGFIDAFLNALEDDVGKMDCLAFPILSSSISPGLEKFDFEDTREMRNLVKEAFCLRELNELSTLSVPIWDMNLGRTKGSELNRTKLYEASAAIAVHLDNVTFPLRKKGGLNSMTSLCASISVPADNARFAHLSGLLPLVESFTQNKEETEKAFTEFSGTSSGKGQREIEWSRLSVTRGLKAHEMKICDDWWDGPASYVVHAPALPLPSVVTHALTSSTNTVRYISRLMTTNGTARTLSSYETIVQESVKRGVEVGMENEELKELGSDLRNLAERYSEGDSWEEGEDEMSEDEEW